MYTLNARFVNSDEWDDPGEPRLGFSLRANKLTQSEFNRNHNLHWGRLVNPEDVKVEWHGELCLTEESFRLLTAGPVPSAEEIEFVIEILDRIGAPALDRVELLLESAGHWNSVDRNDFCRCANSVF